MKKITINNFDYNVPETWMDVRLNQFLKIKEVEDNIDQIDFYDYTLTQLAALLNCSFELLENLTPEQIGYISASLPAITNSDIFEVTSRGIILNGEPFIFDPNPEKMILGMFIDLELFTQDNKIWENAHKIAAAFWRSPKEKIGAFDKARLKLRKKINFDKYTPEEYNSAHAQINADYFKDNMPMPYIYTAVVFFCVLRNKYNQFMLRSLKVKEAKEKKKANGTTTNANGTGTQQ